MSTVTTPDAFGPVGAGSQPRVRAARAWAAANARRAAIVALPPVAASSVVLAATSDHLVHPGGTAAYWTYLVVTPVLVGLLWWRRRPTSRLGPLLVALGFLSWPISWQGSDVPLVYTLGVLGAALPIAMSLYLCLAFSTGRLRDAADHRLLMVLVFVLTLFFGTSLLLTPTLYGEGPLAACAAACPGNPFQFGERPGLVDAVSTSVTYIGLAVVAGISVLWIRRFRAATSPQRRSLVVVAATSVLLVPALFLYYFSVLVLEVGGDAATLFSWVLVGMWILFPLGFAAALLQADLFAGRAFHQLLSELANRPTPERWRDVVAGAIGDESLRLAYWDPGSGSYRDAAGDELEPPLAHLRRQRTEVWRDGNRVAALDVDDALTENPELVDAASSATLLAVETGRLEGELRAAQARVLAASDLERRRIGRDLHDTAQQRLVALRIHLSIAGSQLKPEEQPIVEELGRELDAALDELRDVARGIYPHVLAQHGPAAALRSAVLSAAMPVSITADGLRRHPDAIERTVYFCCLEALQNAAKHAGPGASVAISLSEDEGGVHFRVEDDGVGFEPALTERGAGLENLTDRMAGVGGTILIDSSPGHGTSVAGHIPF